MSDLIGIKHIDAKASKTEYFTISKSIASLIAANDDVMEMAA